MSCLFCKIVNGEIPANKIYEDEKILAFYDIAPEAPVHFLVIPKKHISSAMEIYENNSGIIGYIFSIIPKICNDLSIDNGFRVVTNVGNDGGQTVGHIHFHVLAKRSLAWPPG